MSEIWDYIFFDNTVRSYVAVGVTVLIIFLLQKIISKYLALLFYRILKVPFPRLEKESFVNLLVTPIKSYLVIVTTILSIGSLNFPKAINFTIYKTTFSDIVHGLAQLVLVYAFIRLVLSIIEYVSVILMKRMKATPSVKDDQLVGFFKDFLKAVVVIIGVFLVFKFVFNYPISNIVTAISIIGAALSLAAKESLENIIASFIIFLDDPFEIGDFVKVQNVSGSVEKIGLRSTRIRTSDKTLVTVPNKVMVDSILDNVTMRNQIRGLVIYDLPYILPAAQLDDLVKTMKKYLEEEEKDVVNAIVFVTDIVDYKVKIHVEYYTGMIPANEFNELKNRVNIKLIQETQQMGVKEKAN